VTYRHQQAEDEMLIKSVLITGANRGLGLEFVKQFLRLPSPPDHIIAVCRDVATATELKTIASSKPSVHIVAFEVTDPAQYDRAVAEVQKVVGAAGLNLLINNAGIFNQSLNSLQSCTKQNLLQHMDINLFTPVLLTKAFLPLLQAAAAGHTTASPISAAVVNITAVLGCVHSEALFPGGYPYKYSKAALNMATYCMAEELKTTGVLVMGIHPGWVQTDMGGPHGHLTPEQSISGCMKLVTALNDSNRGKLYDWKGDLFPY
jgi:NAD(P)-dependent dehydrogenase (short-subunit alcohol dehydrogenase family)